MMIGHNRYLYDYWCNSCELKKAEEADERKLLEEQLRIQQQLTERTRHFESEVPPLFRDTPPDKIHPVYLGAVDDWVYSSKGLGFAGSTGTGKTSAIFRLLRREAMAGKRVCFLTATELSELSADANCYTDETKQVQAQKRIKEAKRADMPFLDDLGKGKITERGESTLFDLLDHWYTHQKPVFWTTNSSADGILKKFSRDGRFPLMRRLTETSVIVSDHVHAK
jgi:DNA replication protein DnaC